MAEFTAGDKSKPVETMPFTVEVNDDPVRERAAVFTAGAEEVIPFMVEVILFTGFVNELLLTIGTPTPVIPFTVVDSEFTELAFITVFTIGAVAITPFVVLVIVFRELPKVLVVAAATAGDRSNFVEEISFTVDVNNDPVSDRAVVFTAGAEEITPFILEVIIFAVLVNELLFIIGTSEPVTPLIVVFIAFKALLLPTELTMGAVAVTPLVILVKVLTELPKVLVVAAIIAGVKLNAALAIPFMADTRLLEAFNVNELLFTSFTPVAVTPFTLVVKVLAVLVLLTVFTMGTPTAATPFTLVVSVLIALVLLTEFTIGTVAITPLVVLVKVLILLPNEWVVAPLPVVSGTQKLGAPVKT